MCVSKILAIFEHDWEKIGSAVSKHSFLRRASRFNRSVHKNIYLLLLRNTGERGDQHEAEI